MTGQPKIQTPSQPQNEQRPPSIALELRGVHKHFGATEILRGVDLAIAEQECVAIIGPNGAGKSSLFNAISGLHAPSSGGIFLHGQPVQGKSPHAIHRMGLARSFQTSSLFAGLSVAENLRCALLSAQGYRYSFWHIVSRQKRLNAQVDWWLGQLNLIHCAQLAAGELGYAEQRALELGLTLAGGARVILLDEPTAGMSQQEAQYFVELIRRTTQGKTVVIVEHDMDVVFSLADRIAVLVYGQVVAFDTPERIRANEAVQQAYFGQAARPTPAPPSTTGAFQEAE